MTPKLTDEMRKALRDKSQQPVQVEDEQSHMRYVLLPLEVYQRVRSIVGDDEFDIADTYAAQEEALAKIWDDPELDVYNDYDAHKPQISNDPNNSVDSLPAGEPIMRITVEATYEDGVLKPRQPLALEEHAEVRITIDAKVSRARRTAGLMGWTGSAELADRFALDPDLALEEEA